MQTLVPTRILRDFARRLDPDHFALTPSQAQRETWILDMAERMIDAYGICHVSLLRLRRALRISAETMSFHFADLDDLVWGVFRRLFAALDADLRQIPPGAPDTASQARRLYIQHTRQPCGRPTAVFRLYLMDRQHLPPDLRAMLEAWHADITAMLGGHLAKNFMEAPLMTLPVLEELMVELADQEPRNVVEYPDGTIRSLNWHIVLPPPAAAPPADAAPQKQPIPEQPTAEPAIPDPPMPEPPIPEPPMPDLPQALPPAWPPASYWPEEKASCDPPDPPPAADLTLASLHGPSGPRRTPFAMSAAEERAFHRERRRVGSG